MEKEEKKKSANSFKAPGRTFGLEFLVGVFTILGALAFAYLSINLAGVSLFPSNAYSVEAEFDNISGLTEGAAVEIAGVQVGEVKTIRLSDTNAVITLELRDGIELRDDDIASVRTKGIIGDKYIKIVPGASDEYIENGGQIFDTESVVDFEDVIGRIVHSMGSDS